MGIATAAASPAVASKTGVAATAASPTLSVIGKAIVPGGAIEVTEDEYDGDVNPDYIDPLFDAKKGVYWAYFQMNEKFYKLYGTPADTERSLLDKIKKIKNTASGATPSNSLRIGLEQEKLDITARLPRLDKKIRDLTKDLKTTPVTDPNYKIYVAEINVANNELAADKKRLLQITTAVMMLGKKRAVGGRSRRGRNRRSRRSTRRNRRASSWW